MTARSPFVQATLDAVIPATARWLVARMRRLEELDLDPEMRWRLLRVSLEGLAKDPGR